MYKRPKATLTRLNVMIHKIAGEAGTHLDAREVERGARNLANRYIPKSAVKAAAVAVAHQALTAVFTILLRVMYLDAVFSAADIRRLLLMTEFPINDVDSVAGPLADSLNSANIPGLLRFDAKNRLMAAMHTSETEANVWQAALVNAHLMAPLYRSLMRLAYPDFDAGLDMRFPEIGTLPIGTASDLKFVHVIHTGIVGLAFMGRSEPKMLEGLTAFPDGSPLLSQLLKDLIRLKEQIPMVLRLNMATNTLVVDGYSAKINVDRGHLVVSSGFTHEEASDIHFPRGRCAVERIIVRAPGGTISMEAINWCAAMGIAISFVASDSSLLNCLVPDAPHDGPVKRAQAVSAVTDDALDLARYLLAKKMDSQIVAIDGDFSRLGIGNVSARSTATAQVHACKASLMETLTLVDFLSLEGRAAQVTGISWGRRPCRGENGP